MTIMTCILLSIPVEEVIIQGHLVKYKVHARAEDRRILVHP